MNSLVIGIPTLAPGETTTDHQCVFSPVFTTLKAPGLASHPGGTATQAITIAADGTIARGGDAATAPDAFLDGAGQLITHNGTSVVKLTPGTQGQILAVGASSQLEWINAPSGGSTVSITAADSSVEITPSPLVGTGTIAVSKDLQNTITANTSDIATHATALIDLDTRVGTLETDITPLNNLTKGGLITNNGTGNTILAVGATNGYVLTVDSTATNGIAWKAAATGGATTVKARFGYTADQTINVSSGSTQNVLPAFNSNSGDTGIYNGTTRQITVPAGASWARVTATCFREGTNAAITDLAFILRKNGSPYARFSDTVQSGSTWVTSPLNALIPVSEGDSFDFSLQVTASSATTITVGYEFSAFCFETVA